MRRPYHTTTSSLLNRIFVDTTEVITSAKNIQTVTLQSPDDRFHHIDNILKLRSGDILKLGVLDVGVTDKAIVADKTDCSVIINLGPASDLIATHRPPIDLILAFPRPARLTWLFPVISSLGVGRISLIRAAKTEKGYMGENESSV
jgi:16S rRNA U1498 N3-methylase RsmE